MHQNEMMMTSSMPMNTMDDIFTAEELGRLEHELNHAEAAIERAARNAFEEWGAQLKHIKGNPPSKPRLYAIRYSTWEEYVQERWEMTARRADQLIAAFDMAIELKELLVPQFGTNSSDLLLPARETHIRPLASLTTPEHRAQAWQRIVTNTNGHSITARVVEAEVAKLQAELNKAYITLAEWRELSEEDQRRALTRQGNKTFNETNENIEWAAYSWNPVTGCLHGCPYCYAEDIANRFYPHKFEPTFHPDRLTAPQNTKHGQPRWNGDNGYKGVFVCSMADLFGHWVPQEWIDAVMDAVRQAPQWTFIFLTKNPRRLVDIQWPANAWVGTTIDKQSRIQAAEDAFARIDAHELFVSCEPMLERLTFSNLHLFDWVLVGGQSKSSRLPEFQPEWEWVEHLWSQARQAQCALYWKDNLRVRPREYPA